MSSFVAKEHAKILKRSLLDHCPILLRISNIGWGSKPFRVLDCLFRDKKFVSFVEDSWRSLKVEA